MYQKTGSGTLWGIWNLVGAGETFIGDPAAASCANGSIDLLAIDSNHKLRWNSFRNGAWSGWRGREYWVPSDETPLGDFIYRRLITSLVNQAPGFAGRLAFWHGDHARFSWGVEDAHEFGKLRRKIDAGKPVPIGLLSVQAGVDVHHQAVAYGYEQGALEDLRIYIYDPNHPGVEVTLIPVPSENKFRPVLPNGTPSNDWRTYFVDEAYTPAIPLR